MSGNIQTIRNRIMEIGRDKNHVHFLIQTVPTYSSAKIIQTVKSITAREVFTRHPEVKKNLWGGQFWSDGYFFVNTVSKFGSEATIRNYVKKQGAEEDYIQLHQQDDGE